MPLRPGVGNKSKVSLVRTLKIFPDSPMDLYLNHLALSDLILLFGKAKLLITSAPGACATTWCEVVNHVKDATTVHLETMLWRDHTLGTFWTRFARRTSSTPVISKRRKVPVAKKLGHTAWKTKTVNTARCCDQVLPWHSWHSGAQKRFTEAMPFYG